MHQFIKSFFYVVLLLCGVLCHAALKPAPGTLPKGLMLSLDFENVQNGLIPNNAFFPLYVPQGDAGIDFLLQEKMLLLKNDIGLDIPHSSLIQPNGSEWIISVRLGALSDGMVISQANDRHGYAIYIKDGAAHAVLRTGHSSILLKEDPQFGIVDCTKEMVTVELRIKSDIALLTLNRKRAALARLDAPLYGDDMPIRIGNHHQLPAIMKNIPGADPTGFSGAISNLKLWRQ
jgi:hypothetical protein